MGNISQTPSKVIMVGQWSPGKSSILNTLTNTQNIGYIGFNQTKIQFNKGFLQLWQFGGGQQIRKKIWSNFAKDAKGICVVMDLSIASNQYFVCNDELLYMIMSQPLLANKPLLVIGNKNDVKRVEFGQMWVRQGFDKIKDRKVKGFEVSAKNRQGLNEAFQWLYESIQE